MTVDPWEVACSPVGEAEALLEANQGNPDPEAGLREPYHWTCYGIWDSLLRCQKPRRSYDGQAALSVYALLAFAADNRTGLIEFTTAQLKAKYDGGWGRISLARLKRALRMLKATGLIRVERAGPKHRWYLPVPTESERLELEGRYSSHHFDCNDASQGR